MNNSVCKITFRQGPNLPIYSCEASYLGANYYLTVRHCIFAPQQFLNEEAPQDFSVNPNLVALACRQGYTKFGVDDSVSSREIQPIEDKDMSEQDRLTIRDILIIHVPPLNVEPTPIKLFERNSDIETFTSADQATFLSFNVSTHWKKSLTWQHKVVPMPGQLYFSIREQNFGIISYDGAIFSRGDSGSPLVLKNKSGEHVVGVASNYCPGNATCGEVKSDFNFVTLELLRSRFCNAEEPKLLEILKCQGSFQN